MICFNCGSQTLKTTNSRPSASRTQVWRRRQCQECNNLATTYERYDLSFIVVTDPLTGTEKPYRRFLLAYELWACLDPKSELETDVEALVDTIEAKLIKQQSSKVTQGDFDQLVAATLKPVSYRAYLRYLADHVTADNTQQLIRTLKAQ